MASVLIHTEDESVTLPAQAVRRLLEQGDGDAALLYIALLRHHGTVQPRSLAGELRWDRPRIEAAETVLRDIGLVAPAAESLPPEPADEKPVYQRADVAERLEHSAEFRGLTDQVERKLGKRLTTPDIAVLLGLNDYLGLPADVIYLLVCHCAERVARRFGEGRRPGLKQIEKEGYAWARMGIDTQAAASEYLCRYAQRQESMPRYMRALQLGDRPPVASEEKYLSAWQEMGFPPESVAMAYDKTVLKCHELKWPYCNGILKRWHEAGLHTPEEIRSGDRPAARQTAPAETSSEDMAWMKKYIQQRERGGVTMAYDGRIMNRAIQAYEQEKDRRQAEFQERRERIFRRQPRLREIDGELRSTMSRIISDALRKGTDPQPAVRRLRDENLGLQAEKRELLERMGLPEDCLEEKPACTLCGDTGYRNGQVCRCLRKFYAREQQRELSRMLDLGEQSFDAFSLDWYPDAYDSFLGISPRENMDGTYRICRKYAETFGPASGNLLLTGNPGLGKTFLSAAIAREVSNEGFSVVYDTASHVFERFETQKFGREEGDEAATDVERILSCDLLILDDLGTEMTTAFVQSALYQIVNTRLMEKRSTIINTNLSPDKLAQRYTAQIASRIEGEYQVLPFVGKDIRKLKRERM